MLNFDFGFVLKFSFVFFVANYLGKSPKGDVYVMGTFLLILLDFFSMLRIKSCYIMFEAINSLFKLLSVKVIFGFINLLFKFENLN